MEVDRFISGHESRSEKKFQGQLRPRNFSEYVGQKKVVQNIEIMVKSAKIREDALDHILLSGPPGLGKTSLAMIIAQELGSQLHTISGPALDKKGDLAAILSNLAPRDVLFIDEIHRLHISVEEILYSAMEDYRLDILIGEGPGARTMKIDIAPFTLIGATTRAGLLSNPLRDRFTAPLNFDFYDQADLSKIVSANAVKMGVEMESEAVAQISSRSRGTPRIANRILRRVRDYALVHGHEKILLDDVLKALAMLDIDSLGLDSTDRKILEVMNDFYSGGPVGIEALCATLGEDRGTVEDVYEPFLLKQGLVLRTPRGRQLSQRAIDHLNSI